mmetsp:Transcript_46121/g.53915  ORF Transcript_46121/g.53915 Transcript_46121/m.53915 type:complete len:80 (-) Transcript_46121:410-649(-)
MLLARAPKTKRRAHVCIIYHLAPLMIPVDGYDLPTNHIDFTDVKYVHARTDQDTGWGISSTVRSSYWEPTRVRRRSSIL